jgi:hypothetical protein
MPKCTECFRNCENDPLVLLQSGRKLNFCSWECLIAHSVNRVRRRIAGQNRRMQRFLQKQVDYGKTKVRKTAKHRVN